MSIGWIWSVGVIIHLVPDFIGRKLFSARLSDADCPGTQLLGGPPFPPQPPPAPGEEGRWVSGGIRKDEWEE